MVRSVYSKIAIIELAQPMDYHHVSNTVDSSCTFRVVGAATVILFSLLSLVLEKATEEIGYEGFWSSASTFIYLHRKYRIFFFFVC